MCILKHPLFFCHKSSFALFLMIGALIFFCCQNLERRTKFDWKPDCIPKDAFFVKGNGRGFWCQAEVHNHRNTAFITLYDGEYGSLILAKRFSIICRVQDKPIWIEDLRLQIEWFDGKIFYLKPQAGMDACWLQ